MNKLKENIDRILGSSLRCLLPSYWWKRIFGLLVEEIDDVRSTANSKATKSEVASLSNSVDALSDKVDNIDSGNKIVIDSALSLKSTNPVQNKVVTNALEGYTLFPFNNAKEFITSYFSNEKPRARGLIESVNSITGNNYSEVIGLKSENNQYAIYFTLNGRVYRWIYDKTTYDYIREEEVSSSETLPHDIVIPSSLKTYNEYKAKLAEYGFTKGNTYHVGFQYEGKGIGFKISVGVGSNDIHLWWIDGFGDFWRTTINKYEYYQTVEDNTSHGGTIYIGHELTDELKGMNVKFFRGGIGSDSSLSSNNPLNIGVKVRYYDADKLSLSTYQILSFEVGTSVTDNILRWRFTILRNDNLETWKINAVDGSCTCEKTVNVFNLTEEIIANEEVVSVALADLNERIDGKTTRLEIEKATREELTTYVDSIFSTILQNEEVISAALADLNERVSALTNSLKQ